MSFNEQDELVRCQAQRYSDATHIETWVCRLSDYQDCHGLRVPTQGGVAWVINGKEKPYARFVLRDIEYDNPYAYGQLVTARIPKMPTELMRIAVDTNQLIPLTDQPILSAWIDAPSLLRIV